MTPVVSIIVPHFNRSLLVRETIASVEAQTRTDWELIIVDDGSTKSERDQLDRYASERIRILGRNSEPKGPSRCRNIGLNSSRGEFILFLDSDDLLAPWCLEQRLRKTEEQFEASAWIFPVLLFEETAGDNDTLWNRMQGSDPIDRFLCSDPPWHTSSPLWRRSTLLELGGFNENIVYGDDSDLHLRALLKEVPLQLCESETPDTFIRRSDQGRITNDLSSELLASRRVRLEEGSRLLEEAAPEWKRVWEGQYFHEIEFLLYNRDDPRDEVYQVMTLWRDWSTTARHLRQAAKLYAETVLATRNCCYLFTRIARRTAQILLPDSWFPKPGGFESTRLDPERMTSLRDRLEAPSHPVSAQP